ncbi:hypothetical protein BB559_000888 [Furculomyces boomerangus]|uniref:Uncharacterized protein n=2 Tax=Harpellales TaxID=61421 RepID=A0A2T9Z3R9_9FUNG|nr:hypothetical protein BB559_006377 [Furculomyces boomerangus]PVU99209.1 hypothetical protein BB559_000888 [Furculomyces boomerangus]PWA02087.1 hypothetical protein BB558_001782 [Smittium angustum]
MLRAHDLAENAHLIDLYGFSFLYKMIPQIEVTYSSNQNNGFTFSKKIETPDQNLFTDNSTYFRTISEVLRNCQTEVNKNLTEIISSQDQNSTTGNNPDDTVPENDYAPSEEDIEEEIGSENETKNNSRKIKKAKNSE